MERQTEGEKNDEKQAKDSKVKSPDNMIGVQNRNHNRLFTVLMATLFVFSLIGAAVVISAVLCILNQSDLMKRLAVDEAKSRDYKVKYAFYWWGWWSSWTPCFNTSCQFVYRTRERVCNVSSDAVHIPRVRTCVGHRKETRLCPLPFYCLDCAEIIKTEGRVSTTSGIYAINPDGKGPFKVYCNMTTDGGGWTVFQRRQDGSQDFNRTWDEYKTGFGNLSGEFWLGNEYIHRLTTAKRNRTLRMDMAQIGYYETFAVYNNFRLGNEKENYTLRVESFRSGHSGSMVSRENGRQFSTVDRDHDFLDHVNCASDLRGGWWYGYYCSMSLNGLYGYYFRWPRIPHLTYCDMKIK